MPDHAPQPARSAGDRVLRLGRLGWAVVGIAGAVVVVYLAISMLSGLAVPLVVAAVLGILLHPAVDRFERMGLPRGLGASIVLVVLAAVVGISVWVTVVGVIEQSTEILDRLTSGLSTLEAQVSGSSLDLSLIDLENATAALSGGVASLFGSVFSSAATFLIGTFVAVFFLFYVMVDWPRIEEFAARHSALGRTSGRVVVDQATWTLRRYFGAMTSSNLLAAVLIAIAAALLRVPLAFSIALVTFVTSYVPFLGAIFSGAFAVLIALGSRGLTEALILLGVILVMQNVLQTLVLTKLSSDRLRLHPIINLGSTVAGTVLAGLLGATLSAPVTVMVRDIVGHVNRRPDDHEGVPGGPEETE
ncbi:MAG: AI-2E family transporter [Promicromonosporaceae bacterium]|nr:AI-2E family transporter [Promicromonosporaceae bacterium]